MNISSIRLFRPSFGGLKKIGRPTRDPEVINHKVYWSSEHRYTRRTILSLCNNNKFTKIFSKLLDPTTVKGYGLSHELSTAGPYTGFIPVDDGMKSYDANGIDVIDFIKTHFTMDKWLYRDIIGSDTQPWLLYNTSRKSPEYLSSLNNKKLLISINNNSIEINNVKVLRWNLKCHNGVIHLIERPLI